MREHNYKEKNNVGSTYDDYDNEYRFNVCRSPVLTAFQYIVGVALIVGFTVGVIKTNEPVMYAWIFLGVAFVVENLIMDFTLTVSSDNIRYRRLWKTKRFTFAEITSIVKTESLATKGRSAKRRYTVYVSDKKLCTITEAFENYDVFIKRAKEEKHIVIYSDDMKLF